MCRITVSELAENLVKMVEDEKVCTRELPHGSQVLYQLSQPVSILEPGVTLRVTQL